MSRRSELASGAARIWPDQAAGLRRLIFPLVAAHGPHTARHAFTIASMIQASRVRSAPRSLPMNLRFAPASAPLVFAVTLLAAPAFAQAHNAAPASPYGGTPVEEIIARVNDQVITTADYDRAVKEMDQEARQRGATMQEISEGHKDLLRNLIDQQLWLSKGKELGITGETELIKQLDEIRKKYNLETLEDLEKAAREQGVSFEDFKANIRNGIITQEVMRDQVGRKISITPGEVERYYEGHKQEYTQQESEHLSEILISTGTPAPDVNAAGGTQPDDPAKIAAAKAKADDIEAKLHAGGDFMQLAKTFSDGQTASQGGELGTYHHGELQKVFEDQTFPLKTGQYTDPIRTRQGFVILKVDQHVQGGVQPFKDVQEQVADAYYMSKMEPKIREYLTQMRDEGYVRIMKPGYEDTGASPGELKQSISYSAYTPPSPKKKKKVERTRFRETTRTFRQKSPQNAAAATPPEAPAPKAAAPAADTTASMKPGKKEKIRFGQAPTKTLPKAPSSPTEDAGATQEVAGSGQEPVNPLENAAPQKKTRLSDRAKTQKQAKEKEKAERKTDPNAPAPPDAAEVADRQTQSAPLGPEDEAAKKKKATTTSDKTRMSDRKKTPEQAPQVTPSAPAPGAPAPSPEPQPQTPQAPAQPQ
jgi:peptidyl-prolyl cis-trans isomerase SurA